MAGSCGILSAPVIALTGEGLSWISSSFHFGFATCKVNRTWFVLDLEPMEKIPPPGTQNQKERKEKSSGSEG